MSERITISKGNYVLNYSYERVPTLARFAKSNAFVRGIVGGFGSGKSSACTIEILRRGLMQRPGRDGVKRTRFAVIRQTYRQLEDTTKKTVFEWLPPHVFGEYKIARNEYYITAIPNVRIEILFRALDKPDDVNNLMSMELTGAWVNEAKEVSLEIIDALTGRVGRYPPLKEGGCTWSGIWMDTNPPDEDSWWFKKFEIEKPKGWEVFHQPTGFKPNAENLLTWEEYEKLQKDPNCGITPGLPPFYYERLAEGKSPDFIRVYINGEYGLLKQGKPVFEKSYNDEIHYADYEIKPLEGIPLVVGFDFGLNPSAIVTQYTPKGRLLVLEELTSDGVGLEQFVKYYFQPLMKQKYPEFDFLIVGDPAGVQRSQSDETSCFDILRKFGYRVIPARSNNLVDRIGAVEFFLNSLVEGKPRFLLSKNCKLLRKAFMAGYHYKRLRVSGEVYKDVPDKNWACVPLDYEILTLDGWKKYSEVSIGDKIYSYSLTENRIVEDEILDLHIYDNEEIDVIEKSTDKGNIKFISTPNHRNIVRHKRNKRYMVIKTEDLSTNHTFIMAASQKIPRKKALFSDAFISLCAWVSSEGTYRKNGGIIIFQDMVHNPNLVKYLDKLTTKFPDTMYRLKNSGTLASWRIVKETALLIRRLMPNKYPSMEFINLMNNRQRRLFIYEFLRGDGYINGAKVNILPDHGTISFSRARDFMKGYGAVRIRQGVNNKEVLEAIQIMATLSGIPVYNFKQEVNSKWKEWVLTLGKVRKFGVAFTKTRKLKVNGVWSPSTKETTWICRTPDRQVFITGNSHIMDALQYACLYYKTDHQEKFSIPKVDYSPAISYTGY